ncbi:unnamed protein product [Chrysodeixis includens]|uniref:Uncharacterized protein n=1 Tax=Chrysodeixis includens TaxID=689277 RepID=A0A9P0FV85_CHRIL|nr:unnamed protein product [Chrysodeixis includens]
MNELLQKHGCSNVFSVPNGLRELMSDITREVLRWQPPKLYDFITNYLSALLITREHGILAVKILDDLCDCRPSVSEHLLRVGMEEEDVDIVANIIKTEVEGLELEKGKEKVKETAILKKILQKVPMDEELSAKVCQVARNAHRDYWYRKNLLMKGMSENPEEPWEQAAMHTLEVYKKTRPSLSDLHRASDRIQAAYRGYHVRRNVLRHLQPQDKKKKHGRKVGIPGPPLDIAGSRELNLGPVIKIKVPEDDVTGLFDAETKEKHGLSYDPMMTLTHKEDDAYLEEKKTQAGSNAIKVQQFSVMTSLTQTAPTMRVFLSESTAAANRVDDEDDPYVHYQRISFAEAPPEIITDYDDEPEVPEEPGLGADDRSVAPPLPFEIPEELPVSPRMASAPQSARTDVEDATDGNAEYKE